MENELELARISRVLADLSRRVADLETAEQNRASRVIAGDLEYISRHIDLRHARYDPE